MNLPDPSVLAYLYLIFSLTDIFYKKIQTSFELIHLIRQVLLGFLHRSLQRERPTWDFWIRTPGPAF
jgi:hypothetical protein